MDAVEATTEAVTAYRELTNTVPDRYRPGPASALASLGRQYFELGHPEDALPCTREAVAIRRELVGLRSKFQSTNVASMVNRRAALAELIVDLFESPIATLMEHPFRCRGLVRAGTDGGRGLWC